MPKIIGGIAGYAGNTIPLPLPDDWAKMLPPSVNPTASQFLAVQAQISRLSNGDPTIIEGYGSTFQINFSALCNITMKDRGGALLGTFSVQVVMKGALYFSDNVRSNIYVSDEGIAPYYQPLTLTTSIQSYTGFALAARRGTAFGYQDLPPNDPRAGVVNRCSFSLSQTYDSVTGQNFSIKLVTIGMSRKWPYGTQVFVSWDSVSGLSRGAATSEFFGMDTDPAPATQWQPVYIRPGTLAPYNNGYYVNPSYDSKVTSCDVYVRDGAQSSQGWSKFSSAPGVLGAPPKITLAACPSNLQGVAIMRNDSGAETLLFAPLAPPPFADNVRVIGPDGKSEFFPTKLRIPALTGFSSAWRENDGSRFIVMQRTPGVWEGARVGLNPPTFSDFYASVLSSSPMWQDPDILWVHAAPTPDGGAVAVALKHSLDVDPFFGTVSGTSKREWLFKRSTDRVTWPDDSAAQSLFQPGEHSFIPPSISYVDGAIEISDGYNPTLRSQQMGAKDSWKPAS